MFGSKKKQGIINSQGNTFSDGYGKTEPVRGFIQTESAPAGTPIASAVGATVPGNLIDTDALFGQARANTPDEYGATVPANVIFSGNEQVRPVVGWLVCTKGCNMGKDYRIHSDYNYVGSAVGDIIISGDPKISREKHMMLTYDPQERAFFISPADGANIIRLNGKALVGGGAQLNDYDLISTGDSAFVFVSFCCDKFGWEQLENE